jgi:hypothetical protein
MLLFGYTKEWVIVLRKVILTLLLLINIAYIVSFLVFGTSLLNNLWVGAFIVSILLTIYYVFRSKKQNYNPYLSIAVLALSMGSLGLYVF